MHSHHHHHEVNSTSLKNIRIVFLLNASFTVIEVIGGVLTGSLAVLADALHDFGDTISLALAYYFETLAQRRSSKGFSYGYRRFSLLSAVFTAGFLIFGAVAVLWTAIPKLFAPETPHTEGMFALAVLGIVVNGYAATKMSHGSKLNEQMISWHFWEDLLGWVAVLLVSLAIHFFDWAFLDPLLSILVTGVILLGVFKALKKTILLFLQATPEGVDIDAMTQSAMTVEGVLGVHDLHTWSLDGENHVMTLHAVVGEGVDLASSLKIKEALKTKLQTYGKFHITLELEVDGADCPDVECSGSQVPLT